jgi:hypothetical protein
MRSKNSDNSNSKPAHYLTHALNNSFPNIQLKFSTTKEIENIIKTLKPKNEMKYPLSHLQLAVLILFTS